VFPRIPTLTAEQRRLLDLYATLGERDRQTLLAFAEFLAGRGDEAVPAEEPATEPAEPKLIPRPEEESVVAAIRRLSESYHMLDRALLLNETSSLMTAHVVRGRAAVEVIDDLEDLFAKHYRIYLGDDEEE
jgi:hypothetical protein